MSADIVIKSKAGLEVEDPNSWIGQAAEGIIIQGDFTLTLSINETNEDYFDSALWWLLEPRPKHGFSMEKIGIGSSLRNSSYIGSLSDAINKGVRLHMREKGRFLLEEIKSSFRFFLIPVVYEYSIPLGNKENPFTLSPVQLEKKTDVCFRLVPELESVSFGNMQRFNPVNQRIYESPYAPIGTLDVAIPFGYSAEFWKVGCGGAIMCEKVPEERLPKRKSPKGSKKFFQAMAMAGAQQ